jgi:ATP-binding cassette subfamily B protein
MSRAVNDVNSVRMFLGMGLMGLIQTPVLFVSMAIAMISIDGYVTALVTLPFLLFLPLGSVMRRHMFSASLAVQERLGDLSTVVQENAAGVMVVRSYAMEAAEEKRFEVENQKLYGRHVRLAQMDAFLQPSFMAVPAASLILLTWFGGRAVLEGRMDIPDFLTFYLIMLQMTFPILMLGFLVAITQRGLAGFGRLTEILDTVPSIRDREDVSGLSELTGHVEARNLVLAYGPGDGAVRGVSFTAAPGQTIGIVGSVGSGKSTLVSAIPRLMEVSGGELFLDGVDINRVPLSLLRRSISMVPQESFLFSTSIAENIAFGRPDATREEIEEAARRADVLGDIQALPHGFETVVGERGVTLSGGQRQRVALARALLLRPAILILDDALSSVDAGTEEEILEQLRGARRGRTSFIVAHRISAVRDADQILVMEQGQVVEKGSHAELVRSDGIYARLARRQELEEELEADDARDQAS